MDAGFYVWMAFLLLMVPIEWMIAWVLAAVFHELCHYAAIRMCGFHVLQLRIQASGAIMETDIQGIKACISSLAGPLGGLLLTLFGRQMPRLAVCAMLQSLYNLMPVYPLDGGRAIREMLQTLVGSSRAQRISKGIGGVFLCILLVCAVHLWFRLAVGCIPFLLVLFLAFKTSYIKIPCKESHFRLQYNVNKRRMR